MKKIIFILLLSGFIANAQDKEPIAWEFRWGHSNDLREFEPDTIKQKKVLTGFQWGGSIQMNDALHNNVWTGGNYDSVTSSPIRKRNLILQPKWRDKGYYGPGYWGAVMMQYDPTLPLDDTNEGTILRPDDPTDPVFGFRNRKGTILTNSLDENYSRLILYKDSSYVNDTVLSDIWPQPYFGTRKWGLKGGDTDNYLGRKWYLAINLRRLNPDTDLIKDDSVVIKVRMPSTTWDNVTEDIEFRRLPINHPDSTEKLHFIDPDSASTYPFIESKGYAQLMQDDTSTVVSITRNMLPTSSDNSENITIYAEFVTTESMNTYFAQSGINDPQFIKDIDLEVEYLGKLDVAIDYIRVEEFNAHILNRGELDWIEPWNYNHDDGRGFIDVFPAESDSGFAYTFENGVIDSTYKQLLGQPADIYNTIQSAISAVKTESNNWADADLFRFKFQDTENDSYYWWGALRYCNKFSNGMFMTRDGIRNPKLYYYYTKSPNKWLGIGFGGSDRLMPAPYARHSNRTYDGMKLEGGFSRIHNDYAYIDTLSSEYETQLLSLPGDTAQWIDLERDSYYFDTLFAKSWLTQVKYEGQAYEHYYKNSKVSSFLYSDNPWWFYGLFHNFKMAINADSVEVATYDNYRVKTAEEYRLIASSALIMGCKGFINDGDQNKRFPDIINSVGSLGIGDYNKLPANELLSDSVGTDFVNAKYNTWNAWNYIDLERTAQEMEIDTSRIYIGTKSMRAELFEQHSFNSCE